MGRFGTALVQTLLLGEIVAITLMSAVWIVLAGLHASGQIIIGAEVVAGLAALVAGAFIFRHALRRETQLRAE